MEQNPGSDVTPSLNPILAFIAICQPELFNTLDCGDSTVIIQLREKLKVGNCLMVCLWMLRHANTKHGGYCIGFPACQYWFSDPHG